MPTFFKKPVDKTVILTFIKLLEYHLKNKMIDTDICQETGIQNGHYDFDKIIGKQFI